MYFYIDESGNTGNNLFDEAQPILYYGVLSSTRNLDVLAKPSVESMRETLGTSRLHASALGLQKLSSIARPLISLQKRLDLRFDLYSLEKADFALIMFFDQVFDQGLNPAVPWASYWTPLRYVLLLRLARLFDDELLKKAWEARINTNKAQAANSLCEICDVLLDRLYILNDIRAEEVFRNTFNWAKDNPAKLHYFVNDREEANSISPNAVCFQSVMFGIALRLKKHEATCSKIIVDRQHQFNRHQNFTASYYSCLREIETPTGPGLPELDCSNIPDTALSITNGDASVGLELVDIYLWLFKRIFEEKGISQELRPLVQRQIKRGLTDQISLKEISRRWKPWFKELPEV